MSSVDALSTDLMQGSWLDEPVRRKTGGMHRVVNLTIVLVSKALFVR